MVVFVCGWNEIELIVMMFISLITVLSMEKCEVVDGRGIVKSLGIV